MGFVNDTKFAPVFFRINISDSVAQRISLICKRSTFNRFLILYQFLYLVVVV